MPLHVYIFLPSAALCSMMLLLTLFPPLAILWDKSGGSLGDMSGALAQLRDGDRFMHRHATRMIKAQGPFGYKTDPTSFVSLETLRST